MNKDITLPLHCTEAAANKLKVLIPDKERSNIKLRVYINGGGCSGFKYCFTLDDKVHEEDIVIEQYGVMMIIDPISVQYLFDGSVDYIETLEGSQFIVTNPNAKTTCSCGLSFSV
ncbi:iron-sulfur cluster insertion protein ErpA [Candidatus Profftia tarda]|uniref:Iron-sulfur cluster insertion protein ErpA n=1 Tax=Candidatus Profftia tarda TaxID=1177216 RepID=A0A8E4GHP0_9ENTR|nr:iron-sulfur cluster insertion protein ErpA [Candidatus Profftia tarda]CAD6507575.1 Iron-sulfur cluster insertion protein ErpA [Candidatus Profftia tarda]